MVFLRVVLVIVKRNFLSFHFAMAQSRDRKFVPITNGIATKLTIDKVNRIEIVKDLI